MRTLPLILIVIGLLSLTACGAGQPGDNNHPSKNERAQNTNADKSKSLVWDQNDWDSRNWE